MLDGKSSADAFIWTWWPVWRPFSLSIHARLQASLGGFSFEFMVLDVRGTKVQAFARELSTDASLDALAWNIFSSNDKVVDTPEALGVPVPHISKKIVLALTFPSLAVLVPPPPLPPLPQPPPPPLPFPASLPSSCPTCSIASAAQLRLLCRRPRSPSLSICQRLASSIAHRRPPFCVPLLLPEASLAVCRRLVCVGCRCSLHAREARGDLSPDFAAPFCVTAQHCLHCPTLCYRHRPELICLLPASPPSIVPSALPAMSHRYGCRYGYRPFSKNVVKDDKSSHMDRDPVDDQSTSRDHLFGQVYNRKKTDVVETDVVANVEGTNLNPVSAPDDPSPIDEELPIALRKGSRSCTSHPIQRFVSYAKLKVEIVKALTIPEGMTVSDACRRMATPRVDVVLLTDSNAP
ncbi:CBS domain-containing protein [Nymphaea thermarum]|nr:CBS domain-containing protein [Nymphaea thermarum]